MVTKPGRMFRDIVCCGIIGMKVTGAFGKVKEVDVRWWCPMPIAGFGVAWRDRFGLLFACGGYTL